MADKETVGLVILGLTAPSAVLSCYLPSPSTAYDKSAGSISSGPESIKLLKRGEIIGSAVALAIAAGATLLASEDLGPAAAWIFIGAVALLALFLWEYESAFRKGELAQEAANA